MSPFPQTRQHLPWFLDALPSEDCAKGGAGAYTDALQRSTKESSGIKVRPCCSNSASTTDFSVQQKSPSNEKHASSGVSAGQGYHTVLSNFVRAQKDVACSI